VKTTRRTMMAALGALLAVAAIAGPAGAAAAIPVRFPTGSTHGRGSGYLHNIHSVNIFTFRCRAGRHVRVNVVGHGPTRGIVVFPNGQQDGSPGGVVFDATVSQTGLYHLRVTEDSMAEQWHGKVTVFVTRH
jgi:hypothetical protein